MPPLSFATDIKEYKNNSSSLPKWRGGILYTFYMPHPRISFCDSRRPQPCLTHQPKVMKIFGVGVGHGFSLLFLFILRCFSCHGSMSGLYTFYIGGLYFILNWLNRKYKLMFCLMRLIANITVSRLCSLKGGRISQRKQAMRNHLSVVVPQPAPPPIRQPPPAGAWWINWMRVAIDICPSNKFFYCNLNDNTY